MQNNITYLQKLHGEILTIMDEIDRVCKEYNINYYLVGGTLLGAVRHKGFIPWDDDLDIGMERGDFERFIKIAPKALASKFRLEWITNNFRYSQLFCKVVKEGTLFVESDNPSPIGIFVDIFPLDYSKKYSKAVEMKKKVINYLHLLSWVKLKNDYSYYNFLTSSLARILSFKSIITLSNAVAKLGVSKEDVFFANYASQYKIKKQTMPKDWYGIGCELSFEGRYYKAPNKYLDVLMSIYGPHFMELPPESKRRCHYPNKVIFSDGFEITFDQPINKVTIKDQESV